MRPRTYDSFGKLAVSSGSLVNPFRFTGREYDSETGLYYYRARYYDTTTGRFLGEDTLSDGTSLYGYVSASPTNLVDPSGLQGSPHAIPANPYPPFSPQDLTVFDKALKLAKETACNKDCNAALEEEYGIKSLKALIDKMVGNGNVFDGRSSDLPISVDGKEITIAQYFAQGNAAAMVPFAGNTSSGVTFLADYFFNPTKVDFLWQQRALILLHESVHQFGGKKDKFFGGSANLTTKIADKCFPGLKAMNLLGNLAF